MATFRLEALRMDGENVPFDEAKLTTAEGTTEAIGWEVVVDGARLLRPAERTRTHLYLGSPEAGIFEGDAMVAAGGNRDDQARYYGVRFEGLGPLRRGWREG